MADEINNFTNKVYHYEVDAVYLITHYNEFLLTERSYQTYWQDNNLCVVMKRPTVGIIELGKTDWNGVELDDVVETIYNECIQTERSGNAIVWVRFENPQTDRYA